MTQTFLQRFPAWLSAVPRASTMLAARIKLSPFSPAIQIPALPIPALQHRGATTGDCQEAPPADYPCPHEADIGAYRV